MHVAGSCYRAPLPANQTQPAPTEAPVNQPMDTANDQSESRGFDQKDESIEI